jgi:hypothetical protein
MVLGNVGKAMRKVVEIRHISYLKGGKYNTVKQGESCVIFREREGD